MEPQIPGYRGIERGEMVEQQQPRGRYVAQLWRGDPGAWGRKAQRSFTYQAFIPDPIATLTPDLPGDLVQELVEAQEAVTRLDAAPSSSLLEVIARPLLRAESVASSRIEGLILSHRQLARALFAPDGARPNARAVINNIAAMEEAIRLGGVDRPLAIEDFLTVHRTLLNTEEERSIAGAIRDRQNWIGGRDDSPLGAAFIPPPAAEVRPLLTDLCTFLNRTDLPTLLQAAIAHAQFEAIHPFADGNGRVGRCLVQIVLRRRDLVERYVPPISMVLAANGREYTTCLNRYCEGDIVAWLRLFLMATMRAVDAARDLADRMQALTAAWQETIGARRGSAAARLLAVLPGNPIVTVQSVQTLLGASPEAARLAVERLESAQILVLSRREYRRNRVWETPEVFTVLTDWENVLELPIDGSPRRRTVQPSVPS